MTPETLSSSRAGPAIISSGALKTSIKVERLTCSIGAELGNVNLDDAARDEALFAEMIWDNRCTQHYAVQDFWPAVRNLERAGIIPTRPF
jgi:hypothetical protein